jgi:ornithine--oxo-acid transaminase
MVADEVQSGLGRTGHLLATRAAGVDADVYLLGKALGGGVVPLSAVVADESVLGVLRPGQHGSTFGGNPLACAVGTAVVDLLTDPAVLAHARELGEVLAARLGELVGRGVVAVRTAGPWAGVDVDPRCGSGRDVCAALVRHGVLAKDTHGATLRLSPPLIATADEIGIAVDALAAVLAESR